MFVSDLALNDPTKRQVRLGLLEGIEIIEITEIFNRYRGVTSYETRIE